MTASVTTVLTNLSYDIGAVVLAAVAGLVVWVRHRQPRSVDATMASFRRGLSALAPDTQPAARPRRPVPARPVSEGLTHVRIEPSPAYGGEASPPDAAGGGAVIGSLGAGPTATAAGSERPGEAGGSPG